MWPTIGPLRTYIPLYVLSMAAHFIVSFWLCRRYGLRKRVAVFLGSAYLLGMTLGARILYDVLNHRFDWRNYLDIKYHFSEGLWGGPLAFLALTVPLAIVFATDRRRMLDVIALSLPIPMIIAKVACFLNGCCYGALTHLPWGLVYAEAAEAPADGGRHPTQFYEILVLIVILIVFAALDRRRWKGTLLAWFVLFYGIGRPLTEMFRDAAERTPWIGPFTSSQVTCLAAAVLSGAILLAWRFSIMHRLDYEPLHSQTETIEARRIAEMP